MFNIMKADIYRILKGKLLAKASLLIIVLSGWSVWGVTGKNTQKIILEQFDMASTFLPLFFINLLLILWSVEFTQRTVNHGLIFGIKRGQFFLSKFLTGVLLVIYFVALYFSVTLVGSLFFLHTFPFVAVLKYIGLQLPLYIAILALGFCLFSLMDQPHLPIVLYILLAFLGENIIGGMIYDYFPNSFEKIQYSFIFNNLSQVLHVDQLSQSNLGIIYGSAFLLIGIFTSITYLLFKKRELK